MAGCIRCQDACNGWISIYKKSQEIKPNVKVFFMSAFLSDDIQFRTGLASVKVDEYIEKPISVNEFVRVVKKYLLTSAD